jgi:hypothetical protein
MKPRANAPGCHFISSTPEQIGGCRFWLQEQPDGQPRCWANGAKMGRLGHAEGWSDGESVVSERPGRAAISIAA